MLQIPLPTKPWPIWLTAISIPFVLVGTAFIYYPLLGKSGTLDPHADTIAIPMYGSLMVAVPLAIFVLVVTSIVMIFYSGRSAKLFAWNSDRPILTAIISVVFGGPAILLFLSFLNSIIQIHPWYDYILEINSLLWIAWLLLLRGVLVSRTMVDDDSD
ncbi:hypothetical protein SAMN02745824_0704 [Parasphingorhabdus marina DSM 22363]|uniref:Uncharacterized protein n=1 Tax=Parasphingorhabdus marina DSM 22363 TaxID=1123272 RepID=A0A1N6CPY6_9SPHN|nr:hypothetical protein [Parasphingorhabdus marina]SIN60613.1 hypothetical protein SAMN02745824_0704 [Parasphingorhabdus marina DSM 22363]